MTARQIIIGLSYKYKNDWDKMFQAIKDKEDFIYTEEEVNKMEETLSSSGLKVITIVDDDYPEELKQVPKPPFILYIPSGVDKK